MAAYRNQSASLAFFTRIQGIFQAGSTDRLFDEFVEARRALNARNASFLRGALKMAEGAWRANEFDALYNSHYTHSFVDGMLAKLGPIIRSAQKEC